MARLLCLLLAFSLLGGTAEAATATPASAKFDILGASVNVRVTRGKTTLPATQVPYLQPGDVIDISFPKGVQYSTAPRWHLVVADMYDDYLQHAPSFPIPDANLSSAKPGHVWRVAVKADATPLMFLVPENGNRKGHGIPAARGAIASLANRSLLLRTATLSANAQAKDSTLGQFLTSLARIDPQHLQDGRQHVIAAAQSLFGYDLGSAQCFASNLPQSTQMACAAQAAARNYDNVPKTNLVTAVGSQFPVEAATYGMLAGAIYELLSKRSVDADYLFEPGVIKPGANSTDVYVQSQPSYDASASSPSTIVYFAIGSRATNPDNVGYSAPSALAQCLSGTSINFSAPFNGSPIYFRSHTAIVHAGEQTFDLPVTYDAVTGYDASFTPAQAAALKGGGTIRLRSTWGFDTLESPPQKIVEPQPATWTLASGSPYLVMGQKSGTLTFTDGGADMGSCVSSITLKDATGTTIPVSNLTATNDTVTVQADPSKALGPTASAVVNEGSSIASSPASVALFPAMPKVTHAVAYLPKGTLVLEGTGLKYIDTVTLERTGITFANGTPNADGSWTFSATNASYQPAWEHETMAISYTLQAPDPRTAVAQADVQYAGIQQP